MSDDLGEQLQKLERAVSDFDQASKRVLGFVKTIEYMGISFNVSRRFVIADLSPLAFFHLVEHIQEGPETAVVRLYDRLMPLLSCRHQWTSLKRAADRQIPGMGTQRSYGQARPRVCKSCTAYTLGDPLPLVGRNLAL